MYVGTFLEGDEIVVDPAVPVDSVKDALIERKYVVVKDDDEFIGILTQSDMLRGDGKTVGERLTVKPLIDANTDIGTVIEMMSEHDYDALPFFDSSGKYVGSLSEEDVLHILSGMFQAKIDVHVANIVGPEDFESAKQLFLAEVFHHTKNPIQGIYSSIRILRDEDSKAGRDLLLKMIESKVKQIDGVINEMYEATLR